MLYEGEEAYELARKIYPVYRSITGDGVRETFDIINEYLGEGTHLVQHEIPTGTKVFDWEVPKEWKIREAYIENDKGEKILDLKKNCLHIVGYSMSVDKWVDYNELLQYIYTQPDQPEAIPYVTSYYQKIFGFCMSENERKCLKPGKYHIYIDSEFYDGSLTYGEVLLNGGVKKEVLISTYSCHPSMGNDNCSGLALSAQLIKYLKSLSNRHYTYRFVFLPETIGAIAFLYDKNNLRNLQSNCIGGYTFSCVGDEGDYSMIQTKCGNSLSDRALRNILKFADIPRDAIKEYSYLERGSDERQYNSPGVELGITGFCRTKYWEFPEYHTSLDTIDFINSKGLQGSFNIMKQVLDAIEHNYFYKTSVPCEPQLGKRGLYPAVSQKGTYAGIEAMLNFLGYADGHTDLIEISNRIHQPIRQLVKIIDRLKAEGLIESREVYK